MVFKSREYLISNIQFLELQYEHAQYSLYLHDNIYVFMVMCLFFDIIFPGRAMLSTERRIQRMRKVTITWLNDF